jgi:hypothetical protein
MMVRAKESFVPDRNLLNRNRRLRNRHQGGLVLQDCDRVFELVLQQISERLTDGRGVKCGVFCVILAQVKRSLHSARYHQGR